MLRFVLITLSATVLSAQTAEDIEFFEKNVRPIFATQCQACHSAQIKTAELDLSSAEGFLAGGASGPLVILDNPSESRLLKVVSYEERLKMPPMGKLAPEQITLLEEWIERGAHWPGMENVELPKTDDEFTDFTAEQKEFWAFQPLSDPEPPTVKDTNWATSPIDRFILAKLEEKGLSPAPETDKETLLRRATFDLSGLPPTAAEVEAFLADESPDAFARVVDRLLASKAYGERWGRHWLDVARYADSTGNDEDHRYPYAWRYRDYVIDAFNDDMPYDQFVREQIAGDLLPSDRPGAPNRQGIVATGFLALGPKALAQQDKTRMLYDIYDEQVDVVSKTFLGLTMSCARCHDHKFDPILTRDYYSMINFFANTRSFKDPSTHVSQLLFVPLVASDDWSAFEAHQEEIRQRKFGIDNLAEIELEEHVAGLSDKIAEYMLAARAVYEDGQTAPSELDSELVNRWVAYLKPSGERRYHLDSWESAGTEEQAGIAESFQESFEETFAEWRKKISRWRKEVDRPAEEITMGIPRKPRFEPGENRFFYEVFFQKDGPFSFREEAETKAIVQPATLGKIDDLKKELAALEAKNVTEPDRACAVADQEPDARVDQHVFVRGDYAAKGDLAPKVFPAILEGLEQKPVETAGSGRLELAKWMTEPEHELTSRVMVNRIWHWHFGQGIVSTPSNFGKMGALPSHPELLDYLARDFVSGGWSIKRMHRKIMLSAAYRMSSNVSQEAAMDDATNAYLSHFNRRRLDVEEIRDGLLVVDGALEEHKGGVMQSGFGTDGENSSSRLSVNPDKQKVRTVYLPLRRANLPALLNLFDFGDAVTSQGKRALTNVAPQALFMMNSSFVADRARSLAGQLLDDPDASARVRQAYLRTLNRAPDPSEIDQALTYIQSLDKKFDRFSELDAWESYCRILMASNEFIYVD